MPHLQRARISNHGVGQHPRISKKTARNARRAIVGWTHTNDTPEGRKTGAVWAEVTENDHFRVYDAPYNRSMVAGLIRDCGVANFTMIRM